RSPCPMLNSMANHGWLPHDGKNIDLVTIQTAFQAAMGFSTESFVGITQQALAVSTTGNSSTFHLRDLAHHNAIEHDGSLSRNDQFFGDDLHFNPTIWAATARRYGIRVPSSSPVITVKTAAKARAARVKDAKVFNPAFNLMDQSGSIGGTSVFLTAFWDDGAGGVPKDYAHVLF
ncbi:Cloroperoxidase, partial [Karstenula rhodostoma CBS 690.94]